MRAIEEIKHNPKLLWKKNPYIKYSGIVKLSDGKEASFCMGMNEDGLEHVSIELYVRRLPTWEEMCEVKEIFWDDEEEVVQIHPAKSKYVNMTEALHLWRPADGDWNRLMNGDR